MKTAIIIVALVALAPLGQAADVTLELRNITIPHVSPVVSPATATTIDGGRYSGAGNTNMLTGCKHRLKHFSSLDTAYRFSAHRTRPSSVCGQSLAQQWSHFALAAILLNSDKLNIARFIVPVIVDAVYLEFILPSMGYRVIGKQIEVIIPLVAYPYTATSVAMIIPVAFLSAPLAHTHPHRVQWRVALVDGSDVPSYSLSSHKHNIPQGV